MYGYAQHSNVGFAWFTRMLIESTNRGLSPEIAYWRVAGDNLEGRYTNDWYIKGSSGPARYVVVVWPRLGELMSLLGVEVSQASRRTMHGTFYGNFLHSL